ncbi:helix-turn-helix domain-containing protein [Nocardia neocaledoniensis]|uniref:helix-turn-helix domain-containing protein n=1 Tax=Nocardia neocaledoniensis TaxID=236511 RepID=UPI002455DA98|nr:helix-turn-helix transcriptional regulator [Nocardia neocaledoniensis]
MGQTSKRLDPSTSSAARFGAELRRFRTELGLSLAELGRSVHASGDLLGKIEKAERRPTVDLVDRLDESLGARGDLVQLAHQLPNPIREATKNALTSVRWADRTRRQVNEIRIETPSGQFFRGTTMTALLHQGQERTGGIELVLTDGHHDSVWDLRSSRLVLGALERRGRTRYFAVAAERVRRLPNLRAVVELPWAYELDDFALGLLWAVTNLDDALLDDDAALAQRAAELGMVEGARDVVDGSDDCLSHVSTMWLGSSYCARHILRNAESLSATPRYWTAERSGEAASGWLLFRHKLEYLRRTAKIATGSTRPTRTFCLPPASIAALEPPDRILLLLAVALVESFGIQVVISVEDDLAEIPGFVLDRDGTAILANWINPDSTWQVDVRRDQRTIREFATATEHSVTNNLVRAELAMDRVRTLAEYLGIDWTWLRTRCAGFAAAGVADLVRPRSRLLSLAGVERACAFLAAETSDASQAAGRNDGLPPD